MPSPVPDFVDAARLEFQATLQLLAERACFLTAAEGCAVALEADGAIRFCAISGASERELGSEVALDVTGLHECVQTCQLDDDGETATPRFTLVVPVLREGRALGLLELLSRYEFLREVEPEMLRLADLVTTAWELRDAAEHGPEQILREAATNPAPVLWHAPEDAGRSAIQKKQAADVPGAADIRTCSACGFPVSPGRTLCVECDQKPEARSAPAQLFAPEPEESWWSAHGYTIASLLVTALTAALIVWLRR